MTPLGLYDKANTEGQTTFIIGAGSAGEIGYSEAPFWAADDCFYLQPQNNVINKYIFYCLLSQKSFISTLVRRGSVPRLSRDVLGAIHINLPQYHTQQDIVNSLSFIDSQIISLEKLIDKQEAIKKSTVKLLMTPKEGWKEKSLAEMGEFFKGGGVTMKDTVSHGVPCTMYGDIYVKYNIMFDHVDYFLPPSKAAKATKAIYGDLLFTASGETAIEIGKCAGYFGNTPICIGGDIIALRPNDDFDSLFLAYLFNSNGCIRQKARLGQGDAVVHIKVSNLSSIKLFVPPTKSEQIIIAKQINELDNQLLVIKQKLSKAEAMKQGMMRYFFGN